VASVNKYEITVSTKDTSDPKKAERIKKQLDDPTYVSKNLDVLRKDIGSMSSEAGTKGDDRFVRQAVRRLKSITDSVVKASAGLTQVKGKQPKQTQTVKENKDVVNELKEAAKETKKAAKDIKEAAKEFKSEVKKTKKDKVSITKTSKAEDAALWESKQEVVPKKTVSRRPKVKPHSTPADLEVDGYYSEERVVKRRKRADDLARRKKRIVEKKIQPDVVDEPVQLPRTSQTPKKKFEYTVPMSTIDKVSISNAVLSQRKERISLPSQTQTAEQRSLISSSDVLMSQIQKDFKNFKVNFAKSIRAQLTSSHGRAFQVIGEGKMPYTRRGGAEVLKIANIDMLIGALRSLTNISMDTAIAMKKSGSVSEMVTKASRGAMIKRSAESHATSKQTISEITKYINKHGYEGLNEGITKIVRKQRPEGGGVTEQEIRKALLVKKEGAKRRTVSPEGLQDLLAETAGRSYVQESSNPRNKNSSPSSRASRTSFNTNAVRKTKSIN